MMAAAIVVGWAATGGMRVLVLRTGVLDRPNVRSSHTRLTATMGGVGIMAGLWAGIAVGQGLFGILAFPTWKAFLGSTAVLVLLAYDEVRPMGRLSKLAVQVGAGVLLVTYGVVLQRITLPAVGGVDLGWMGYPITLIWLVGLQNLYNFMDGIDGIAALEALLVAGMLAGLAAAVNLPALPVIAALAGACLGFLVWNLPPARIFMGDVGSNFLGFGLGAMAVVGEEAGIPFWIAALFLGAFLYDSLYTILRRLLRGENITVAHRIHLYQRLVELGWTHGRVNLAYGTVTLLLGAAGYLAWYGWTGAALAVGVATAALVVWATIRIELAWREKDRAWTTSS